MTVRVRWQDDEVLYVDEPVPILAAADLKPLRDGASRNLRRRMRLCAHPDLGDPLHEMFIVNHRDVYVRPHKHVAKAESFLLLEGEADLVLFDDQGAVTDAVRLAAYGSARPFYYRVGREQYHSLLVRSDFLVFHEATTGPFERSRTVLAPWSPGDDDAAGRAAFLARVRADVERLQAAGEP